MTEVINFLALASRAITCYDLIQTRNLNQVCFALARGMANECLIYLIKQEIYNEEGNSYYG